MTRSEKFEGVASKLKTRSPTNERNWKIGRVKRSGKVL